MHLRQKQGIASLLAATIACFACLSASCAPAPNQVPEQRTDKSEIDCKFHSLLEYELNMPIYLWTPRQKPKGVLLAMHGLAMHGQSFSELAKMLAEEGFIVYASDMRGYGRLTKEYAHEFCDTKDCKHKVNYVKSADDLLKLADRLKSEYKGLPLYMLGESMGADMAIRIASQRPELADGLVLSSPAIRTHYFIDSNTVKNLPIAMTNFRKQLDIMPYVRKYASKDPRIVSEMLADPLIKRKMSSQDLYASRKYINDTLSYVPNISSNKPILVLQDRDDKVVRADAIVLLMSRLKSSDQQVCWYEGRGHIILETAHLQSEAMNTILSWLKQHNYSKAALETRGQDEMISAKNQLQSDKD